MIQAKVIADSVSGFGARLTTLQLRYPRFIHAEFMTHRVFCLAGDARLDFDMPAKSHGRSRRVHSMTIREFVNKWLDGSEEHRTPRHSGKFLSLPSRSYYTAKEVANELGLASANNLNNACRLGKVADAEKQAGQWVAPAESWEAYRNNNGTRSYSLRSRLAEMNIRQINEATGEIQTSKVVNVQRSGVKQVFEVSTTNYKVAGSKDHLVFTQRGWVRIGDLVVGEDHLRTYKYGTGVKSDPFRKINGRWVNRWNLEVRDDVAARQNYLCANTGEPLTSDFHIHHVLPRHQRPDLAFDINNVIAVNPEAHKQLHGTQGWQTGVPLQSGLEVVTSIVLRGEEETFDLEIAGEFPNFFANGIVVHNSRNASSSRAIPVWKVVDQVRDEPAAPIHWGRNQSGMQAQAQLEDKQREEVKALWGMAARTAARYAAQMEDLGAHKQIVNRILEPFTFISVVVTSTEWANFMALRAHPDAQPEIQALALAMRKAMDHSQPKMRGARGMLKDAYDWHLPYIKSEEVEEFHDRPVFLAKLSAARCARVSYNNHDGTAPSIENDLKLFERLVGSKPLHASPTEHQAYPLDSSEEWVKNFRGWKQFRSIVETWDI